MNPKVKWILFLLVGMLHTMPGYSQGIRDPLLDTVRIAGQLWLTRNLDVDTFQNGDTIQHAPSLEEWLDAGKRGIPAWCYYNNDPALGRESGRIYNWYAASDKRNIAPIGWRVPSAKDIELLLDFTGINFYTYVRLASKKWLGFRDGVDVYGFKAMADGRRFWIDPKIVNSPAFDPKDNFRNRESGVGYWLCDLSIWSGTNGDYANVLLLNIEENADIYGSQKHNGYYIRCIKNE